VATPRVGVERPGGMAPARLRQVPYTIRSVPWRYGAVRNEFTAIIEQDEGWYIAYCPEIPGANGQGKTKEEARQSLADAISLILEDRREDGLRSLPPEVERETVTVG